MLIVILIVHSYTGWLITTSDDSVINDRMITIMIIDLIVFIRSLLDHDH